MICYRDTTFCTFHEDCAAASECGMALTDEVKKKADKWWETFESEDDVPFCVFADKPGCWEKK